MKSTGTFSEISQLHTKYQDRALAIDEEIEALKREKSELAVASDVVYAIYRTVVIKETDADIDVLHGFIKASAAELDDTRMTEFSDSRPVPAPKGYERDGGIPVSRCVDSMLWTLFAMKIREETGPSLKARVEKMMTEHVTKNAFIVERAIDEYEYTCKIVWEMCEPASDFETVVAKAVGIVSEGAYSDEEAHRVFGQDYTFEGRLAVRACARVRQARARLIELVGKR
jgi:hypothetical protein